ncbi:MAG: 16S rRNA (guanine(966)-N(2))-methyltransferase RsmD [Stagnimonas sp.]|nr:16S rRNA (guanine(966)-N(2))-methyltransferase RsmD [Stagnimonas sp.]
MKRNLGELRIIGGEWRSRLVNFDADPQTGLRATPDRVRQTVFDWLHPIINGALCLDLFAGSGAMGLEALSRGAEHCTFIDSGRAQVQDIRHAIATFKSGDRATVIQADALRWLHAPTLASGKQGFDVVFIDPPFAAGNLLVQALPLLGPLLKPAHRVMLEWGTAAAPALPPGYEWLKQKQAGAVGYGLVQHLA